VRRQEHHRFAPLLTPELFRQAALEGGLTVVCSPRNLVNLAWLALRAARHPELSFAALLDQPLQDLRDREGFPGSELGRGIRRANRRRGRARRRRARRGPPGGPRRGSHSPHGRAAQAASPAAFAQARRRMPTAFWVALLVLLAQRFQERHAQALRWGPFRLLAVDGTGPRLPDGPALRQYFGAARNGHGSSGAPARLVLLLVPLARFPLAYALQPCAVGEAGMARRLPRGLRPGDLVLPGAGFRSYGVLAQVQQRGAFFCLRQRQRPARRVLKRSGPGDEEVQWRPKDSRGRWRRQGLPDSIRLGRLTYRARGYRPLVLLTNVLPAPEVPYERWWGLTLSEQGEVLARGLYNFRWEIEKAQADYPSRRRWVGTRRIGYHRRSGVARVGRVVPAAPGCSHRRSRMSDRTQRRPAPPRA
jgi:hypothetical protein